MKTLALILLLFAAPAFAGDDCHVSRTVPRVTDWTIVGGQGSIIIDARLAGGSDVAELYRAEDGDWWSMSICLGPFGTMHCIGLPNATVTDSTLHVEVAHAPGTFDYSACVDGQMPGEAQVCTCAYELNGTLTILPDATPARRASWGAVKGRWR